MENIQKLLCGMQVDNVLGLNVVGNASLQDTALSEA